METIFCRGGSRILRRDGGDMQFRVNNSRNVKFVTTTVHDFLGKRKLRKSLKDDFTFRKGR